MNNTGTRNSDRAIRMMVEQWQSSEKDGGTVAEHGKDWRNGKNNCRAVRSKVEQWQSMENIGGTLAEQREGM